MGSKTLINTGIIVDTRENLNNISDTILPKNTLVVEKDTGKMRVGDDTTPYKDLDNLPSGVDIATSSSLGVSKPDGETITIDENGVLKSKSIPFDGGSIFAVLAGNNEGSFTNEGDGTNNHQQRPNLGDSSFQKSQDGKSFCHIEDNAVVLDEDGFYIVRLRRAFYPDSANTGEMDLTQSISYKSVGSSAFANIGTQTLRMNNDPDLWQYCDFSIVLHGKTGDAISTLSYEPVVAGTTIHSGSFGLYLFKIPVTNEYQVSNAEYMGIYQTDYVAYLPTSSTKYPGENYFDIDWTQGGAVNETPDQLNIVDNTSFTMTRSGLALLNFGLSFSVSDESDPIDLICECLRISSSGDEVTIKAVTMPIRKELLSGDVFGMTVLAPVSSNERIRVRVRTNNTINVNIGCIASVSCTILPSVAASAQLTDATTSQAGRVILATEDQALAGTEAGAYALTPATGSKMAAHMAMPSNRTLDISITELDGSGYFSTVAPDDGYFVLRCTTADSATNGAVIELINLSNYINSTQRVSTASGIVATFIPISKGETCKAMLGDLANFKTIIFKFIYANGSAPEA